MSFAPIEKAVLASPLLQPLLAQWQDVKLPNCWLVAGAVAQTVWNQAHGLPPDFGIKDIDLVYYDGKDLSQDAEAENERRIGRLFEALPVAFDVKNEARVHLWYQDRYGTPIDPYGSAEEAIATFPTTATAIGLRPSDRGLDFHAPFGPDDLLGLTVRPNKAQITPAIYRAKVARWQGLWPGLTVIDWDEDRPPA